MIQSRCRLFPCAAMLASLFSVQAQVDPPKRSLDVVVEDRVGRPVVTLQQADFDVVENGHAHAVEAVLTPAALRNEPRYLALIFDKLNAAADSGWMAREAGLAMIAKAGPATRIAVLCAGELASVETAFTLDRAATRRAVRAAVRCSEALNTVVAVSAPLWALPGRKHAAIFTAGSGFGDRHTGQLGLAIRVANEARIAVYAIDVSAGGGADPALGRLAKDTGGAVVRAVKDWREAAARVVGGLENYYELQWPAAEAWDGQRVEVLVHAPGLRVSARRSFRVGVDPAPGSGNEVASVWNSRTK